MTEKLNIGILGCADIAWRSMIPAILDSGKYNLVAVASRDKAKAELFANKFNCKAIVGYENLLTEKDIDVIYIPLPVGLHYEWIKKTLQHGKHVLAEKSFCESYDQAKELVDLANQKGLGVFENFMFVFHSQISFALEQLKSGVIGDLRLLRSSFGFPKFKINENIRYQKELGGGALNDAGGYTLMAAQIFLGEGLSNVSSYMGYQGNEVDFMGGGMLINDKGIGAQVAFGFDNFYQNNIELWGTTGKITLERAFTAPPGFSPQVIIEKQTEVNHIKLPADNHFINILNAIYAAIDTSKFDSFHHRILSQSNHLTKFRNNAIQIK